MATATQFFGEGQTLTAPTANTELPLTAVLGGTGEYRCDCGHVLRVFGGGRHRVYFELGNARLDDPVMNRVCPQCHRGLPGKNAPRREPATPAQAATATGTPPTARESS